MIVLEDELVTLETAGKLLVVVVRRVLQGDAPSILHMATSFSEAEGEGVNLSVGSGLFDSGFDLAFQRFGFRQFGGGISAHCGSVLDFVFDGCDVAFDLLDAEAEVMKFGAQSVLLRFDETRGLRRGICLFALSDTSATKAHTNKDGCSNEGSDGTADDND
jgi:hypothetical protein